MKLRIKMPLIYAVLIASLGVVFILFTSRMVEDRMVEEEQEYFKSLTNALALNSANAIVLKDYAALSGIVDNMRKGEHVSYAVILDENGSVLAHSQHELEGKALTDPVSIKASASRDLLMQAAGSDTMDVTAPLMIAGKKWGAVRIGFSLAEMKMKVAKARNIILFAGLAATLLGIVASILIAKKITDPIHKLHKGTEIIGGGNFDYRVDISTGDEVEQLAVAFNAMTEHLQKNYLAIERAKKEWEETFDAISDPLLLHDKEFKVIRCNRAYAKAAGMSFKEIMGKPYYKVFPKMEVPMRGCLKVQQMQEEGEEELFLHDGGKTYNVSFYLIKDVDGRYLYSLHIMEDITEGKKAERALRESEEKFRIISTSAKDAIIMMDNDGNISYWNEAAEKIFGYTAQEALGKELHIFLAPDRYHAAYRGGFPKFKKTGAGPVVGKTLELTAVKKDGTEFPMELSVSVVKLKDKWHAIGILRDITARKKAEEALRKSESSLTEAQRIAHLGNWNWDILKNELRWSDEIYRIFGLRPQEFGATYEAFLSSVHPDDREFVKNSVNEALYKKRPYSIDHRIVLPDGSIRFVHEQAEVTFDDKGVPVRMTGTVHDITEQKKADEELHELFVGALTSLAAAIEAKSPWTKGHSERVMEYALQIGRDMGLSDEDREELRIAALLHDIGKIGTYDEILDKPEKLTDEEFEMVKRHPGKAEDMLLPIKQLKRIIPWIRGHHERYDGKGYPDGLKGEEIPLQARILAVADTFDSMTAERPYRKMPGREKAIEELKRCSVTQFDPKVVEAFLKTI